MEVHHHSHGPSHQKKRWTHYFWEFFMLFLAVTLGFFVENQREHLIEHRQEKQYMKLMREDLVNDTAQLQNSLADIDRSVRSLDSSLFFLVNTGTAGEKAKDAYRFSSVALMRIPVVFTDRTLTQLKNSGRMRIVRSQKVMDALTHYWNHIEVIRVSLDRHNHYRSMGRDLEIKIFNLGADFLKDHSFMTSHSGESRVTTNNPALIIEYANTISYCGVVLEQSKNQLIQQHKLASQLIDLIQREYHLK
jgi:hypothetical protein